MGEVSEPFLGVVPLGEGALILVDGLLATGVLPLPLARLPRGCQTQRQYRLALNADTRHWELLDDGPLLIGVAEDGLDRSDKPTRAYDPHGLRSDHTPHIRRDTLTPHHRSDRSALRNGNRVPRGEGIEQSWR